MAATMAQGGLMNVPAAQSHLSILHFNHQPINASIKIKINQNQSQSVLRVECILA
jgi:hypothetical protein